MSDTPNPFDLGPAANPIDNSQFKAALDAWYADRDRIINEVFPKVDQAIATVNDWTGVINNLIALIQQVLPIVMAMMGSPASAAAASTTTAGLKDCNASACGIQQALSYVQANLPGLVQNVPGLFNQVQNLLKK